MSILDQVRGALSVSRAVNEDAHSRELFPEYDYDTNIYTDSPADAFRHATVSARLTVVFGHNAAQTAGTLNERVNGSGPNSRSNVMDEFNNSIGRDIGGERDGLLSGDPIADIVEGHVRSGITINSLDDPRIGSIRDNLNPNESVPEFLERTGGIVPGPRGVGYSLFDPRGPWQEAGLEIDPNVRGSFGPGLSIRPLLRPDDLELRQTSTNPTYTPPSYNPAYASGSDPTIGGFAPEDPRSQGPRNGGWEDDGGNFNDPSDYPGGTPSNGHNTNGGYNHSGSGTTTGTFEPSGGQWEGGNGNQGHGTPDPGLSVDPDYEGIHPIILDLDGLGISVTELSQSTIFVDGGDGLEHRTAWAEAGDGVLFYDEDGSGDLSERREYVFTDWDPTATSDLEALRSVFDTNGDGRLTNADSTWSQFKVARTEPDGTLSYHTLDALGITEINLMGDATNIELPDGSVIEGNLAASDGISLHLRRYEIAPNCRFSYLQCLNPHSPGNALISLSRP